MKIGGLRLSYGNKWLIYSGNAYNLEWVVYEHKYRAKKSNILIRTQSQDEAIRKLCGEDI